MSDPSHSAVTPVIPAPSPWNVAASTLPNDADPNESSLLISPNKNMLLPVKTPLELISPNKTISPYLSIFNLLSSSLVTTLNKSASIKAV